MKNNKRIVICVSLIVIMIGTLLVISNKPKKTFEFNGSTIALLVNGKVSNTFPSKGLYQIDITCDNADGVWDIDNWKLDIKNITGNVSCNVSFTSNPKLLSNVVNTTSTSGEVSGNGLLYKSDYGVRYKGNNPNNFIWYNGELYRIIGKTPVCTEVNTDGTCKTWNNNGLVKIIRNDSIGAIKYGSNSTWMGSNIQNLLNTCYLGKKSSCDSYCYSYETSAVGLCDYSSDGIDASDYYGNMIEDVYFNVGAGDSAYKTAANYYTQEIATHATSTSKIGLMYASDWGYAIEGFTGILGFDGYPQNSSDKNWLFSNGYEWTMSAYSSSNPLYVADNGYLNNFSATDGYAARPVLYLKSNVYVVSGTGTKVDPYRIGM